MYLVLVDAMDKSKDNITIRFTLWGSSDITDQYIVYFLVYLEEGGKFRIWNWNSSSGTQNLNGDY